MAPEAHAQALADCWNLSENIEHAPGWWRRMFLRLLGDGSSPGQLSALVERASGWTLGARLVDPPVVLGPMGCTAEVAATSDRLDLVDDLAKKDPRAGDALNSAANDWRAAITLETSQFLVAIYPG